MGVILKSLALSLLGASLSVVANAQRHPNGEPPRSPLGVWEAPIGHRQPNTSNVPADVLQSEGSGGNRAKEFDKKLSICRGC